MRKIFMKSLLWVKNVHKTYETESKPLEVLKGVSLEVMAGEALAILGASGAGKSTLLHIMGTLDRPTAGEVFYKGEDLFAFSEKKLSHFRNRKIGFVFQFHHLLPMLDALENTMLPQLIAGSSKKEARKKAARLLDQVSLADRFRHRPSELSGGEQQRVAIARALVMDPQLLFADEPTGNLDSHTGEEVSDLLMNLREQHGMSIVVATHNERLAQKVGKRVLLTDGLLRPQ
jgi:lipoprotein-releasing system ATP-binding protein